MRTYKVDGVVTAEVSATKDKNSSVRSDIGDQWYLHVIADMVNEKTVSEQEFYNIFMAHSEKLE